MNAQDEAALALWQRNRGMTPMSQEAIERMNSLLADFYGRPTQDEFDRIQSRVSEIMSCPEIISSPSPSLSQGASH